jgi:hypothetical protein
VSADSSKHQNILDQAEAHESPPSSDKDSSVHVVDSSVVNSAIGDRTVAIAGSANGALIVTGDYAKIVVNAENTNGRTGTKKTTRQPKKKTEGSKGGIRTGNVLSPKKSSQKRPRKNSIQSTAQHAKIHKSTFTLTHSRNNEEIAKTASRLSKVTVNAPLVTNALMHLLRINKNNKVIIAVMRSLSKLSTIDESIVQDILKVLRVSQNNEVAIIAMDSLSNIAVGNPAVIREIRQIFSTNRGSTIIKASSEALSKVAKGDKEVVQAMISKLAFTNSDKLATGSIIKSLGEIANGDLAAIRKLASFLTSSTENSIIRAAADSLGKIAKGDRDTIRSMESFLRIGSTTTNKIFVARNLRKIDPDNQEAAKYIASANNKKKSSKSNSYR